MGLIKHLERQKLARRKKNDEQQRKESRGNGNTNVFPTK